MRLILLRHGLTEDNVRGVAQGRTDTPLNDEGRQQAVRAAEHLADIGSAVIVTSELRRSKETGLIIAQRLGITAVTSEAALNEMSFGIYEQQPYTQLRDARQQNLQGIYHWKPPQGESPFEAAQRITPLIKKWLSYETVIAIGHGSLNRVFRAVLLGEQYNLDLHQSNCCINEFYGDELGKYTLVRWNHSTTERTI